MSALLPNPRHPETFPRRVLVATLGLAPQVVTETLWALAKATPAFVPTEAHAITTSEGAKKADEILFGPDGSLAALAADLELPQLAGVLTRERVHVIGGGLADIDSLADNSAAADRIAEVIGAITGDDRAALHVSVAGGRKTMAFLAGYALSMFARPQDRLSHVLVAEPFQSHPDFHFPPKVPATLILRDGRAVSTANANLVLAEIPVIRLRSRLPQGLLAGGISYSQFVAEAQRAFDPPRLVVDLPARRLVCGDVAVDPEPVNLAFALWLAERARALGPAAAAVHWRDADWNELAAAFRRLGLADPPRADGRVEEAWFLERKSRLAAAIRKALGEAAGPYLPKAFGARPHTRTGFALEPAQIEVRNSAEQ